MGTMCRQFPSPYRGLFLIRLDIRLMTDKVTDSFRPLIGDCFLYEARNEMLEGWKGFRPLIGDCFLYKSGTAVTTSSKKSFRPLIGDCFLYGKRPIEWLYFLLWRFPSPYRGLFLIPGEWGLCLETSCRFRPLIGDCFLYEKKKTYYRWHIMFPSPYRGLFLIPNGMIPEEPKSDVSFRPLIGDCFLYGTVTISLTRRAVAFPSPYRGLFLIHY